MQSKCSEKLSHKTPRHIGGGGSLGPELVVSIQAPARKGKNLNI